MYFFFRTLLFILSCSAQLFARELVLYGHTTQNSYVEEKKEFSFGLPPIGDPKALLWSNSFSVSQWKAQDLTYSVHRWSPVLIWRGFENWTATAVMSTSFAATQESLSMNEKTQSSTFVFSLTPKKRSESGWRLSYGVLLLDPNFGSRFFPIVAFSYESPDKVWKFGMGYPALALSYAPSTLMEYSLFFSRESNLFYVRESRQRSLGYDYLEQNLNSLGIGLKYRLSEMHRLAFKAGTYFNSDYTWRNLQGDRIADLSNESGYGFISLSLSIERP